MGENDKRRLSRDPASDPRLCGHYGHRSKRTGDLCGANVITGTKACGRHSGKSRSKAKAEGAVVVELHRWGLTDATADPGEVLLRLVTQSAARVALYARLLEEAFDAAERLRAAESAPDGGDLAHTARLDLERVFNHGGVSALIGHTYAGTQTSGVIATGEAIRGLAKLEGEERDRCASFATKAIAAGLAERQVRLAERQGAVLAAVIGRLVDGLGLSADQRQMVPSLLSAAVAELTGQKTIEGAAA
jgi:hypothetical protein